MSEVGLAKVATVDKVSADAKSSTKSDVFDLKPESAQSKEVIYNSIDGIPLDIYKYFSMNLGENNNDLLDKVREIYKYTSKDGKLNLGDTMMRMRKLETMLGATHFSETRQDKMFNWCSMQRSISDLQKRQQSLLKTKNTKVESNLTDLKKRQEALINDLRD